MKTLKLPCKDVLKSSAPGERLTARRRFPSRRNQEHVETKDGAAIKGTTMVTSLLKDVCPRSGPPPAQPAAPVDPAAPMAHALPVATRFTVEDEATGGEVMHNWLLERLPAGLQPRPDQRLILCRLPWGFHEGIPHWLMAHRRDIVACSHHGYGITGAPEADMPLAVRLAGGGLAVRGEYRARRLYYAENVDAVNPDWEGVRRRGLRLAVEVLEAQPPYRPGVADPTALDGLVLPDGMLADIQADLQAFLAGNDQYDELELPWKRGYMFIGPPGNGKTRMCRSLANYWGLPTIDLARCIQQDGSLAIGTDNSEILLALRRQLRRQANPPPATAGANSMDDVMHELSSEARKNEGDFDLNVDARSILAMADKEIGKRLLAVACRPVRPTIYVLEDIDKFVTYQGGKGKHQDAGRIPLHELLKAMDGVHAVSAAVVVATTNYIDELAEALINRPGRFDRIWEFPKPDRAGLAKFLKVLNLRIKDGDVEDVAGKLEGLSMAFAEELVKTLRTVHRRKEFSAAEVQEVLDRIHQHDKLAADRFGRKIAGLGSNVQKSQAG